MKGNTRVLLGVASFSTIALLLIFTRTEFTDSSRVRVVETWNRVHESLPDLTQKPSQPAPDEKPGGVPTTCDENEVEDLSWLSSYELSPSFQYTSRDIVAIHNEKSKRPLVTQVEEPLFKEFATVNLEGSHSRKKTGCLPPLTLEVAQGSVNTVDASHIIFGMQTTVGRLKDTVKHIARWLPNTGSQIHSIVIENEEKAADPGEMGLLEQQFYNLNMNVTVRGPLDEKHGFAQRYFSIVEMLYNARTPETKWIVLIDDDTFFPSMKALVKMLDKHDPAEDWYIGSVSEDWNAVNHYGMMGFGGAGIFLSLSTAANIVAHKEDCNVHLRTSAGDITVMDCIHRYSDTKLTRINGLHQLDIYEDQSGFYESGREYLSVHHWKAKPVLPMEKMHLVADVCGQCFLQRWQFPNDFLLANGYSVSHYPLGNLSGKIKKPGLLEKLKGNGKRGDEKKDDKNKTPEQIEEEKKAEEERRKKEEEERKEKELYQTKINLLAIEETWFDGGLFSVEHSLGPVRPKLKDDMKLSYLLVDSVALEGGVVRQVYIKKGGEGKEDAVIALNWRAGDKMGL